MRGTSLASLAAAETAVGPVVAAAGADAATLGAELFALVDALDGSGSLRRTLADPALPGAAKERLVRSLLAQADPRTVDVAAALVQRRWSADADLAEAVERVATQALLTAAEVRGELAEVEDELFRFGRALLGQREVLGILSDPSVPAASRAELVERLLGGKASDVTLQLARRAAAAPRGRRYPAALGRLSDLVAERRQRSAAAVTVAVPLTAAQRDRLGGLLERALGHAVQINEIVDPAVLGGLRVQVGPQVMDATTLGRLADARRRMAG
ncbi:F0F1 ATP synthase subunit delta [Cellulomonas endophytica]|uniref:F0F1 ATP synthase subunit delta n=1 Tax=Cellulomonas endophytica TaxID=2494735 RepID=UPI00101203A9|nr:F0F1 ATP synthase subunit delta [Cellulomonas endophytica]